jgi:hypothetical protein
MGGETGFEALPDFDGENTSIADRKQRETADI